MKSFVFPFLLSILISFQLPFHLAFSFWDDAPESLAKTANAPPDSIGYGNKMIEKQEFLTFKNGCQNSYFYSGSDSFLYLYSETSAPKIMNEGERTPLNIALVLDRSGSMQGDKLKYTLEAAKFVIDNLDEKDIVSIITYESEVQVVAEAQKVTNKQHLKNLIDKIGTGGSTNLSGGMFEGYTQVAKNKSNDYINRVLLMSDGLANQGIADSATLVKAVSAKLEETGISLSTFGVGADFNENLMQSLAEAGGNYYFINSPYEIPTIFAKEMNGLLLVAAQNLRLTIMTSSESMTLDKVYGYRYKQEGGKITIDFHDIFSKEKKAVLLRFKVNPQGTKTLLIEETIRFTEASNGQNHTLNMRTTVNFLEDPADYSKHYNETVLQQILIFESNDIMEIAMRSVDNLQYEDAKKQLQGGRKELDFFRGITPENDELARQDSLYDAYEQNIDSVKVLKGKELKNYQKDNKMRNYENRKKK